jgi:hypothetical protein
MMLDKHLVVISRKWNEPFIRVSVTDLDIKIVMSLEDFAAAVAHEIGANTEVVQNTFDKIVNALKAESSKVM